MDEEALIEAILVRQHPERRNGLPCIPFRLVINHIFVFLEKNIHIYNYIERYSIKNIYGYFSIDILRYTFMLYKCFNFITDYGSSYTQNVLNIINPSLILSIKTTFEIVNEFPEYIKNCVNIKTLSARFRFEYPFNDLPSIKNLSIELDGCYNHLYFLTNLIEQCNIKELRIHNGEFIFSLSSSFSKNIEFLTDVEINEPKKIVYFKYETLDSFNENINSLVEFIQPDVIIGPYKVLRSTYLRVNIMCPYIMFHRYEWRSHLNDYVSFIHSNTFYYPVLFTNPSFQPLPWTWKSLKLDMKRRLNNID